MPEAAKAKKPEKASRPRRAPARKEKGDEGLESLVRRLVGEIEALRSEVSSMKAVPMTPAPATALDRDEPEQVEAAADAVLADMVQQMGGDRVEDENVFLAEMQFAIANPEPTPVESEEPGDEEAEAEFDADQMEGAQFDSSELDDLIRAFEKHDERSIVVESSDNEALSEGAFDALLAGSMPTEPAPAAEVEPVFEQPEPECDVALSEDEIAALFMATSSLGAPAPTPEPAMNAPAHPVEDSDEVLSAAEIQAMLGLTEVGGPDLSLEAVAPPIEVEAEPSMSEGLESAAEPLAGPDTAAHAEPEIEPDLETVDPEAVRRVPAELAVAALAMPVCCIDDKLYCLCAEPIDQASLDAMSRAVGLVVVPRPAPLVKVVHELRTRYGHHDLVLERATAEHVPTQGGVKSLIAKVLRRPA